MRCWSCGYAIVKDIYIKGCLFCVCYYVYSTHAWVISLEDKKDESKPK